jgi:hypothetical protein
MSRGAPRAEGVCFSYQHGNSGETCERATNLSFLESGVCEKLDLVHDVPSPEVWAWQFINAVLFLAVGIWSYRRALQAHKPAVPWILMGLAIYFACSLVVSFSLQFVVMMFSESLANLERSTRHLILRIAGGMGRAVGLFGAYLVANKVMRIENADPTAHREATGEPRQRLRTSTEATTDQTDSDEEDGTSSDGLFSEGFFGLLNKGPIGWMLFGLIWGVAYKVFELLMGWLDTPVGP